MKHALMIVALLFAGSAQAASSQDSLDQAAMSAVAKRALGELSSAAAKRSVRGTRALWTDVVVQKAANSKAFDQMEADLRSTEVEAQLRDGGFKLMDPAKRSLAVGLRPTLVLSVYFVGKGTEGNASDLYVVTARATQEVLPLGGERMTMTTWLYYSGAIASKGEIHEDIIAIRSAAKACVKAFIDTAKDEDVAPSPGKKN